MILGALGAVEKTPNLEVELQPDDRILLYTDGITEVFNLLANCYGSRLYWQSRRIRWERTMRSAKRAAIEKQRMISLEELPRSTNTAVSPSL
jgi:hypothetical protein